MSVATHYTTLGLMPSAASEVIRAAYKALALIYHPDKTLKMAAEERASHAAVFRQVQEAYDVLRSPALKAAYDAELEAHRNTIDKTRSPYQRHSSARPTSKAHPKSQRKRVAKLTTPEEKAAMRARARQSLDHLREKRVERHIADAELDIPGLKDMVHTWEQLAEEHLSDPTIRAHCAIRVHEYQIKIAVREQQQQEWLSRMPIAKQEPSTCRQKHYGGPDEEAHASFQSASAHSTATRPQASCPTRVPSSQPVHSFGEQRATDRVRAAESVARSEARAMEKAQREASKQAHLDSKAAAIRADKEKQKAKAQASTQKEAERIAEVRAKAGAAPLGTVGVAGRGQGKIPDSLRASLVDATRPKPPQTSSGKACGRCGSDHATFREWRMCNSKAYVDPKAEDQAPLRTT
ncbi:hypothetical protein DE146DRAFT_187060 [Phaeosphaeria sp. MPI-PUGE-AT-0046c]|nr:hypothetical protein DE146DRAFT_187060 [Phaeosphaeria sp. MPI-PUGE-AT-0046c]